MSDALNNLREHAPSMPSASGVRDAVQSHLPSVDLETVRKKANGKRSMIAIAVAAIAGAVVLLSYLKRRSQ